MIYYRGVCPACCYGFKVSVIPKDGLPANILDNFALHWNLSKEDVGPLQALDKAEQRRIIAGTPERNSYPLKHSSNQRLWVSLGGASST
jgi:hypothetical protein